MKCFSVLWLLSSAFLASSMPLVDAVQTPQSNEKGLKTALHRSPEFILGPGEVVARDFYNVEFPKGHIALKEFKAEIVDENGIPVPLYDVYLHHWIMVRYRGVPNDESVFDMVRNAGPCQGMLLGQYYGLGAETRRTVTHLPDPYGIEVGNPAEVPDGYVEKWLLYVHAIDTRGVVDRMGCTECRCDLFGVTHYPDGRPLVEGYKGGVHCCDNQNKCRVQEGNADVQKKLYVQYTVKYVDWDESIVPVKIYILDVTDNGERAELSPGVADERVGCKVEYTVESCGTSDTNSSNCVESRKTNFDMPRGGNLIFAVGHQHWGGVGGALYGQDGRILCTSMPIYGNGKEAGNEDGYVVGMSSCFPKPGSVTIADGERLTLEVNYSSSQMHTGVMGIFYITVEETKGAAS